MRMSLSTRQRALESSATPCSNPDAPSGGEPRRVQKDLGLAVERDEFFLVYQPIFKIDTGAVVGVELCFAGSTPFVEWSCPMSSFRYSRRVG